MPVNCPARAALIAVLLIAVAPLQAAPGYFPGSYYAAHVIRVGGERLPNDTTTSGYRWENFSVRRVSKGNRIPAILNNGLEVYADIYGMPVGDEVTLRVVRPVTGANGERESHVLKRNQPLYRTDDDSVQVFNYFFFFDEPQEMTPGKWLIELTHGDTTILRQTFDVVAAPPGADPPLEP